MENSLFSRPEQNAYCLEVYLEHCQTSQTKYFEKIIDSFELLTIFAKFSISDVWQGSEYASAADIYFSLGK